MLRNINIKKKTLYIFIISFLLFLFLLNFLLFERTNLENTLYRNYIYSNQAYNIFSFYQRNKYILDILRKNLETNKVISSLNLNVINISLLYSKQINPYIKENKLQVRFKTQNLNDISKIFDLLKINILFLWIK